MSKASMHGPATAQDGGTRGKEDALGVRSARGSTSRRLRWPALLALTTSLVVAGTVLSYDLTAHDVLEIPRVEASAVPVLDGRSDDPVWSRARPVTVLTRDGANLPNGESRVEIRAVADATHVYFAFRWEDPARSLKHLPLVKTAQGWRLHHSEYDIEDEDAYYEDKFAVVLANDPATAGGVAHLGPQPLPDKPKAFSGRGLHYTTNGGNVDLWHWKAVRGGLLGHVDDNYIGPPAAPKPAEVAGKARYKAGYQADPGKIGAELNFKAQPPGGYAMVQPSRLPRDLAAVQARMGRLDLAPDSMTEAPWNMSEAESAPYSPEANAAIPVGTVIPGVIIKGEGAYEGDRGDLEAGAIWADGHWMLEVRRALDTCSSFDTALRPGEPVYLWVGVFDHSQTRHSRHIRPIALKLVPPSTS